MGGFNCRDKLGGVSFFYCSSIRHFNHFFFTVAALCDLGFIRAKYPWSNNRKGNANILVHLDRVFANFKWLNLFSKIVVRYLPQLCFDHCSILLEYFGGQ